MKKLFSTIFIFVTLITSSLFVGCKEETTTMNGYYMLSLTKSSVRVNGVERNLPDYLDWQGKTLDDYETFGAISIYVEENYIVVYSDGKYLADGSYLMDGENVVCSADLMTLLKLASVQNLKWKDNQISFTMNFGEYTHNRVYVKMT